MPKNAYKYKSGEIPDGEKVERLRLEARLSQTEFGEITYSSASTVSGWERGTRNIQPAIWEFYLIYFKKIKPRYFVDPFE